MLLCRGGSKKCSGVYRWNGGGGGVNLNAGYIQEVSLDVYFNNWVNFSVKFVRVRTSMWFSGIPAPCGLKVKCEFSITVIMR